MAATAAYTGARRSELIRMEVEDVDFAGGAITVREKKRSAGSTRRGACRSRRPSPRFSGRILILL